MLRSLSCLMLAVMSLAACSAAATNKKAKADGGETFEEDPGDPVLAPPRDPDYTNDDSGAVDLGSRKGTGSSDGGRVDDASYQTDAKLTDGGVALCTGPFQPGDVKVVEIMISSITGSGDRGEWVELQSTKQCRLNVKGLRVESPRGTTSTDGVTISTDLILPPNGTFVVAGSTDATVNHNLPSPVLSWGAADVLKNDGDTVTVKYADQVIDSITYPNFSSLQAGRSISFPSDCAWSDRSSWARWSYSFTYYDGILQGTPNADNDDVACY